MIRDCRWQLRVGPAGTYGLDFGAVLALAHARGMATPLLAAVLPDIERVLIAAETSDGSDAGLDDADPPAAVADPD